MVLGDAGPLLVADELVKVYPISATSAGRSHVTVRAVDGISLAVGTGETLGIVGESGSGKSTLARLLVRLEDPSSGRLKVSGKDVLKLRGRALRAWRRSVQMVFQDPHNSLDPRMRIIDAIIEAWKVHPEVCPRSQWQERAAALLDSVGLSMKYAYQRPRELSGGQRQRVAIARALAVSPSLIVCDEPVSALDVSIQAQVLNVLRDVRETFGVAYIFISHDLSVVRHVSDRVAVMYLGKIVESGPTAQVYQQPRHPYTRALLSAEPVPHFERDTSRIILQGEIPSPTRIPGGCRFHTRCWKAQAICKTTEPALTGELPDHLAACHFPETTRL